MKVDVARSGGIAGMTRRWSAHPAGAEASEWISLIDRCPWDDPRSAAGEPDDGPDAAPTISSARDRSPVPDGFTWRIRAMWSGTDPREAELVDADLVGAWRELVDAVREWNESARR